MEIIRQKYFRSNTRTMGVIIFLFTAFQLYEGNIYGPGVPIYILFNLLALSFWIATDVGGVNLLDRQTRKFSRFIYDPEKKTRLWGNNIIDINKDMFDTLILEYSKFLTQQEEVKKYKAKKCLSQFILIQKKKNNN